VNQRASYPHLPPDPVAGDLIDAIRAYADGESVPRYGKTPAQEALGIAHRTMEAVDALGDEATPAAIGIAEDELLSAESDLAKERILGLAHLFCEVDRSLDRVLWWGKDVINVPWSGIVQTTKPWAQASLQNRRQRHLESLTESESKG
jgi:hypothetical protein